jgi:hypothetical protein
VRRLALLLAVEAVALVAVGLGYAVSSGADTGAEAVAAVAAVVTGGVLALLARAVDRGRSWARAPAVTLNLLPLPVAAGAFQAGAWQVGLPLVLLAGTALYLLAHPDVRAG